MQPHRLILDQPLLRRILEHCLEEKPYEACGVLTGRQGRVTHAYATDNARRSRVFYEVDPQQQGRILQEMEDRGDELLAIYHSHPDSPAYPSRSDIQLAVHYPQAIRMIISLRGPAVVQAYLITNGQVKRVELESPQTVYGKWHDLRSGYSNLRTGDS